MTLSFADGWVDPVEFAEWPLVGSPRFATSRAYEIFLRELRRYTLEEVPGRSFLIAGHRGAGKTFLVTQAIEELRSERIRQSIQPDVNSVSRRGRLQRPLLVKLAAKSLISPPPVLSPESAPAKEEVDGNENGGEEEVVDANEGKKTKKEARNATIPSDPVAGALVHLTIALYRALAREVAQGYAIHAGSLPSNARADGHELAAQLLLDLDDAPEPALLRRKWSQLGRLVNGVLWPRSAAATLAGANIEDQGFREIVAVTTASQAFQVVSGNVTYKTVSTDSASREHESEAKFDVKDLVARLGSVFAGTVAGSTAVASGESAALAVGLGLLVWLGSSLALTHTLTRKFSSSRSRDYTFLRDRSVQTLDRELPQVIERIRDAGLAPIFVLDELDKLPNASATIGVLIDRLKHIVSDFGFFCFLTNRDYFDALDRLVTKQAYPSEHTYFSDRLLILARPQDLFDYVVQLIISDTAGDQDNLPRATFALMVIYRSKLNFTDLSRELNRHARSDRSVTLTAQTLRERRDLRLEAAIQLATEEALRTEPIATRFAQDEAFAQIAVDALYYIPRMWEENCNDPIDCSDATLVAKLLERSMGVAADPMSNDQPPAQGKKKPTTAPKSENESDEVSATISTSDLALLRKLVDRQISYLSDFGALAKALRERQRPDPWRLDEIVPQEIGKSLIEAVNVEEHRYRFSLDNAAWPIFSTPTLPKTLSDKKAEELTALFGALDELLVFLGVSLDAVVRAGYLPATLTSETVADARKLLAQSDRSADVIARAQVTADLLKRALLERGRLLTAILVALEKYRVFVGASDRPTAEILLSLARYFPMITTGKDGLSNSLISILGDALAGAFLRIELATPAGLTALTKGLEKERAARTAQMIPRLSEQDMEALWEIWRIRLLAWIEDGKSLVEDIGENDLICAVQNLAPGSLFKADLATMSISDWSAVVAAGFQSNGAGTVAPTWTVFVGLYALGISATALNNTASLYKDYFTNAPMLDMDTVGRFQAKASESARPALLLLARTDGAPILGNERSDQPIIVIAQSDFERYSSGVEWLIAAGVIEGVIDESE